MILQNIKLLYKIYNLFIGEVGIVDECCYKACKISQLEKYCN